MKKKKRKPATRLYKPDTEEVIADFDKYLNSFPGDPIDHGMKIWQKSILALHLDNFFPKYGYALMKVKK
jgi:hypothetical protein